MATTPTNKMKLKEFYQARNEDQEIKREYRNLKSCSIYYLRERWSRVHRVGNPYGTDKIGLITDIIRAEYGDKKVDRAFNIK